MVREALQERFTRLIWWVMFTGIALSVLAYGVFNPPRQLLESGLLRVLGVLGWTLFCRLAFWKKPLWGAGAVLLGVNLATPVLVSSGPFDNSFALLSIASLPTLFLSTLWGWPGGALALLACLPSVLLKTGTVEQSLVGWVILLGTAFSGSLIHRLLEDVDRTRAQLEAMAMMDPLTRLGNRFALQNAFSALEGSGKLCMWDVNGLKRVNDERGHHAGDRYLLEFVTAFKSQSDPSEPLYRVGGDEFVSLHAMGADLEALRERVREVFAPISVGWAVVNARDLDAVLKEADRAMYADKGKRLKSTIEVH